MVMKARVRASVPAECDTRPALKIIMYGLGAIHADLIQRFKMLMVFDVFLKNKT